MTNYKLPTTSGRWCRRIWSGWPPSPIGPAGTARARTFGPGHTGIEVLPIENDLWRFYRLNVAAPTGG